MFTCPFLGNRFARKVLYYKYLSFVANYFHYYLDSVMPQGKYYISLPKLITPVIFWHVMKTRSCQAAQAYLIFWGTGVSVTVNQKRLVEVRSEHGVLTWTVLVRAYYYRLVCPFFWKVMRKQKASVTPTEFEFTRCDRSKGIIIGIKSRLSPNSKWWQLWVFSQSFTTP